MTWPSHLQPEPLDAATTAADYTLAAIGLANAPILVAALGAGWLTPEEAASLRGLRVAVAYLAGLPYPEEHRGRLTGAMGK